MRSLGLFVLLCAAAAIGGALGSVLGHGAGHAGLFVGGVLGGLVGSALGAALAVRLRLVRRSQLFATATGAAVGFLAAAAVATHTLSSPVGPVLSTSLVGLGALAGARLSEGGRPPAPPG